MNGIQPRQKSVAPLFGGDGEVYVGGCGEVTTIQDPDGVVRRVLVLADGTRTCSEIYDALVEDFPYLRQDDIVSMVSELDVAGFLEDAKKSHEGVLDYYSVERWERNLAFFESYATLSRSKYELQRKLQHSRVALLGVGGLGSHLLLDLAAVGIGAVRIIDFDEVSLSNLNRQIIYTEADVGCSKTDVAAERVRRFNSRLRLDAVQQRISSAADVEALVSGFDVVISVVDRPTMEVLKWVNEGCVSAGVPFITGGVDSVRAVYSTILPGRTGCITCWRRTLAETDPLSTFLLDEKERSGFEADTAAFGPLVTTLTGLMLVEIVRLVTGIAPLVGPDRLTELRFDDSQTRVVERWRRHAECPVCATATPSTLAVAATIVE